MINFRKLDVDLILKMFFCLFFSVFVYIYSSNILKLYNYMNIENLFLLSYNIVNLGYIESDPVQLLIWITPIYYLMYMLGEYVNKDLSLIGIYIFTRTDRRSRWLLDKVKILFLWIIIYFFIQYCLLFLLGIIGGFFLTSDSVIVIVYQFLLSVLFSYLSLIITNVLMLFIKSIYSFITVSVSTLCLLFICSSIIKISELTSNNLVNILKYIPVAHAMLSLHDLNIEGEILNLYHIDDFGLIFSFSYLLIFIGIVLIIGIKQIKHMDIL